MGHQGRLGGLLHISNKNVRYYLLVIIMYVQSQHENALMKNENSNEPKGRAKGGKARAANMSAEERKAASAKATAAKKAKSLLPTAINEGELKIGDLKLDVAVLPDGKRVILQSAVFKAFGRPQRGERQPGGIEIKLPPFMDAKNLVPFINQDVIEKIKPIEFKSNTGVVRSGYDASILPAICNVYLKANDKNALRASQASTVKKAEILVRGLAEVGVIALIDEATGYQRDRERDALAKILEAFVAKEIQPWIKTFPADYYENLFRLRGLDFPPENPHFRPQYFGVLTNDIVYKRIAPGVLEELKKQAAKGSKGTKLHQGLTPSLGHQKLKEHLASVTTIMKLSDKYIDFIDKMNRLHPRFDSMTSLDLQDEDL